MCSFAACDSEGACSFKHVKSTLICFDTFNAWHSWIKFIFYPLTLSMVVCCFTVFFVPCRRLAIIDISGVLSFFDLVSLLKFYLVQAGNLHSYKK